jgi:6-pyruvoyltetrahydropterin/6-carboxytetrahydropterin synthase
MRTFNSYGESVMYTVKKQLDVFSAAHRLVKGYQGKCKDLHGHDYLTEVTVVCDELDEYDFVIDFGDIKRICNEWLQNHWDHATLVSGADANLLKFVREEKQHHFVLPEQHNSTVEYLVEFLFYQFQKELKAFAPRVTLKAVSMWESATACATFTADSCGN